MSFQELLAAEFRPYGNLSAIQLERLDRHYKFLLQWNPRLNLTRILGMEEAVQLHYCESLFVGTVLPKGPLTVCDVGSGAGFPGVPLAILREDLEIALLESDQRKAVFLREATRELENVRVIAKRLEECGERFDWVVSRAVAPREVLTLGSTGNFALLTSADRAQATFEVIRLPWGRNRVLAILHVPAISGVPRGTKA